jgi:hypothetical protein
MVVRVMMEMPALRVMSVLLESVRGQELTVMMDFSVPVMRPARMGRA